MSRTNLNSKQNNSNYQSTVLWISLLWDVITLQLLSHSARCLISLNIWSLLFATRASAQPSELRTIVPEFQLDSMGASGHYSPAVAPLVFGGWVVAWNGGASKDIYVKPYNSNNTAIAIEFQANTPPNVGGQYRPAILQVASDEYVVAWDGKKISDFDIYARRFANKNSVLGSDFLMNTNVTSTQQRPALARLVSGNIVAVWQGTQSGNWDIYACLYAANVSALSPEFRVNNTTKEGQYDPKVTSLNSGIWVVVWDGGQSGDYDIYAQQFAVNGTFLGDEFRINSNTTANQEFPTIANLSIGDGWVVAWQCEQGKGDNDIYMRHYLGNHSVLNNEVRVNTNTLGDQRFPAVTGLTTGGWVVVWESNQSGDWDIYARIYTSDGDPLGSDFRVNINTTGTQETPAITSLVSGDWIIVWGSYQSDSAQIYGSIFSLAGSTTSSMQLQTAITTTKNNSIPTSSSSAIAITSTSNEMKSRLPTQQQISSTNDKSGTNGTLIGIVAGVSGVIGLGACAAAIGFYACRKKSNANKQLSNVSLNEPGAALQDKQHIQGGDYARISFKSTNKFDNIIPVSNSDYSRIDEIKKPENQYDNAPKLEI